MNNIWLIIEILYILTLIVLIFLLFTVNLVYSLYSMLIIFLIVALIYFLLGFEYLGFTFLIIYVGAIAVLFLFVVMMMDLNIIYLKESIWRYLLVGLLIFFLFIFFLDIYIKIYEKDISIIYTYIEWEEKINNLYNIDIINFLIFKRYYYYLIVLGFVLFVMMLGVVYLTIEDIDMKNIKEENNLMQNEKDFEEIEKLV